MAIGTARGIGASDPDGAPWCIPPLAVSFRPRALRGPPDLLATLQAFHRSALRSDVVAATPLLAAIAPEELACALSRLRFAGRDAWRGDGETWSRFWMSPSKRLRLSRRKGSLVSEDDVGRNLVRLFRRGAFIRAPGDPAGALAVRVVDDGLELAMVQGDAVVLTRRGLVRVDLPLELPDTLAEAARGRTLDSMVGSSLLDGADYRVRCVRVIGGRTLITAHTGRMPFQMPWPDLP